MSQGTFSLRTAIEQVSQEKGIDPKLLVEATEQAILTAAKRTFGPDRELEARFNEETGSVDLFQYMTVVEEVDDDEREVTLEAAKRYGLDAELGEELGFQIFYLQDDIERARQQDKEFGDLLGLQQSRYGFGRIAAQTAKQVILQRVRDAERDRIYQEFKEKIGEIVTGIVRRFERGSNIIVDMGRGIEAVLPSREQTPRESYRPGDRIVALMKEIDREARGPQLILSRTDVGLLVKLFEMEVPEIYEGIVRIVAAAREPGARSKIAVASRDNDVDPVGACVGMKGSRVQAVVQELRGEKIDIVPFDRDPARFVCNAIAPAEVVRVVIDENHQQMELVVPDAKLSLAIGRRGQNVRLASQLTQWKLDIVSEARFREMQDESIAMLARIGLDENTTRNLYDAGFRSLDEIVEASDTELASIHGIRADMVARLQSKAAESLEQVRLEDLGRMVEAEDTPTESGKLRLLRGVTDRIAQQLERGGYLTVSAIARETEVERLATRCELPPAKAAEIHGAAKQFMDVEWPPIEAAIRGRRTKAAAASMPKDEDEFEEGSAH